MSQNSSEAFRHGNFARPLPKIERISTHSNDNYLVTSVVYDLRVKKERSEKQSPESLTEISRWEMRNLHRDNPGQEFTQQIDISLYYAELSIGPVLSIATGSNMDTCQNFSDFHSTYCGCKIYSTFTGVVADANRK